MGVRGTPRRGWGRRGTKVRQRLQLKYEWRYLFASESVAMDLVLHGPESGRPPLRLTGDQVLAALGALDARWVG